MQQHAEPECSLRYAKSVSLHDSTFIGQQWCKQQQASPLQQDLPPLLLLPKRLAKHDALYPSAICTLQPPPQARRIIVWWRLQRSCNMTPKTVLFFLSFRTPSPQHPRPRQPPPLMLLLHLLPPQCCVLDGDANCSCRSFGEWGTGQDTEQDIAAIPHLTTSWDNVKAENPGNDNSARMTEQ